MSSTDKDAASSGCALPIVDELGVEFWDDQVGCSLLQHARGGFADGAWCRRSGEGREQALDDVAAADFARVQDALVATGVPVNQVIARSAGIDGRSGVSFEPWAWSWA